MVMGGACGISRYPVMQENGERAVIRVKVTPRSSRDRIAGHEAGVLRIQLQSPPVEGRANKALRMFLAERLGVPPTSVEIVSGARSRVKTLRIRGCSQKDIMGLLKGEPN